MAIVVAVAAPGCASKKYVRQQINGVNQRAAKNEKDTNAKVAWLTNKEQSDVAQLHGDINQMQGNVAQMNQKIDDVSQKQTAAAAAMSDTGTAARSADETVINSTVMNALNYQLVDKANVMFAFNKATLSPAAKASLDQVVARIEATPRAVVELAGFTDRTGTANYNLELSRRRAWTVQRYLVEHNVSPRSIHMVGLGEEPPPEGMGIDGTVQPTSHRNSRRNEAERRVNIRILGPGEAASTTSSAGQ
jgi:outer membrane protein OmpA-like peptidoglycan-associated protein